MKCHICKKKIEIDEEAIRISYGRIIGRAPWGRARRGEFYSEDDEYLCKKCAIEYEFIADE